jgi:ELWxxDGT repeat protein
VAIAEAAVMEHVRDALGRGSLTAAFATLLGAASVAAQIAFVVDDEATPFGGTAENYGSGPAFFAPIAGEGLFFLTSGEGGGPWVAVGDPDATSAEAVRRLLLDAEAASVDTRHPPTSAGGVALFVARTGEPSDPVIWRAGVGAAETYPLAPRADGTGPTPVLELGFGEREKRLVVADGVLFFAGCEEETGCEVWRSTQGLTGVELVADLAPGAASSWPGELAASATKVWWRVELDPGSHEVASLVRLDVASGALDIVPFDDAGNPILITPSAERAFFFRRAAGVLSLWVSDGTPIGTLPISLTAAPHGLWEMEWMTPTERGVCFVAYDPLHGYELWESDGTVEGTRRVSDFGNANALQYVTQQAVAYVDGAYVFYADDGIGTKGLWGASDGGPVELLLENGFLRRALEERVIANQGSRLWSTDGSSTGTFELASCTGCTYPRQPASTSELLFTDATGLWRSDGTVAGTFLLMADARFWDAPELARSGSSFYFSLSDSQHGVELWRSRGSDGVLRLVADIEHSTRASDPMLIRPLADRVWYRGFSGGALGARLLVGTAAVPGVEAMPVPEDIQHGSSSFNRAEAVALDDVGYFLGPGPRLSEPGLWRTDATAAGTFRLPLSSSFIHALSPAGDELRFFLHEQGALHLWAARDGGATLVKLATLPAEVQGVLVAEYSGEGLFFLGLPNTNFSAYHLWFYDDESGEPRKLAELGSFDRAAPPSLAVVDGFAFASQGRGAGGVVGSDGTESGTFEVVVDRGLDGPAVDPAFDLVAHRGDLYFATKSQVPLMREPELALWRLPASATEAEVVHRMPLRARAWPNDFSTAPTLRLSSQGDLLYFVGDSVANGVELWAYDVERAATGLVADIHRGPHGSHPMELVGTGSTVYFTAYDGVFGRELWKTDGTAAGTRLVHDIAPGSRSSNPRELTLAGSYLYFSADDGLLGRELWAVSLTAAGCEPNGPYALCLQEGRYRAETFWRDFQRRVGRAEAIDLTDDTGAFWFFDPENIESIVKVLDGASVNGHTWVFAGSLTNVELYTTVTDTVTGTSVRYFNALGTFASFGDVEAFGPNGARAHEGISAPSSAASRAPTSTSGASADGVSAPGECSSSPSRLCIADGKFAVEVTWRAGSSAGAGQAVPWTRDTGAFWFFDAKNVELVVKVLDGTAINGHTWVFYGALTDVAYTLRVTDTMTGAVREYHNPQGVFASRGDTSAF